MCGEKYPFLCANFFVLGSPPRVRGKGFQSFSAMMGRRITPACAGKRSFKAKQTAKTWDHPRVCGEKLDVFDTDKSHLGSPPRVRGKVHQHDARPAGKGITPACAGKRPLSSACILRDWDHPRVCGEKYQRKASTNTAIGSPPRVRGKVYNSCIKMYPTGITPACAGKSLPHAHGLCRQRDHPRVCGEKTFTVKNVPGAEGSPPRVRGKAPVVRDIVRDLGITPACAGKSRASGSALA